MSFNTALEKLQESILSSDASFAAPLVRTPQKMSAAAQIAIYSDAYRIRLQQAVRGDYPCLAHYLGEADFKNLVNSYAAVTPSFSYNLDFYPFGFWRFVRKHYGNTAIGDIAELEGAMAECFMMPGSQQLLAQDLPAMDEKKLAKMKFHLRTPSRLLSLRHDVESAMAAFKRGDEREPVAAMPTCLFLYRHQHEVQRRFLEESEYHLLRGLAAAETFGKAVKALQEATGQSDEVVSDNLMRWLPRWIREGFLAVPA